MVSFSAVLSEKLLFAFDCETEVTLQWTKSVLNITHFHDKGRGFAFLVVFHYGTNDDITHRPQQSYFLVLVQKLGTSNNYNNSILGVFMKCLALIVFV